MRAPRFIGRAYGSFMVFVPSSRGVRVEKRWKACRGAKAQVMKCTPRRIARIDERTFEGNDPWMKLAQLLVLGCGAIVAIVGACGSESTSPVKSMAASTSGIYCD